MPRAFDTFLDELYSPTEKKAFAGPAADVPAQYKILNLLVEHPEGALVSVLQRESALPFIRFAQALENLVDGNLVTLDGPDEDQRATMTDVGAALMR
jgi:hypothetical protein